MQDQHVSPSSSRMLAGYLTDIEQLLDEQHRDAALREAFDLPRIAVALTDPQLRCSGCDCAVTCARRRAVFPRRTAKTSPPRRPKRLRCVRRWSKPHAAGTPAAHVTTPPCRPISRGLPFCAKSPP